MIVVFAATAPGVPGQVVVAVHPELNTWDEMQTLANTYRGQCGSWQLDLVTQDSASQYNSWNTWSTAFVGQVFPNDVPGAASFAFVFGTGTCQDTEDAIVIAAVPTPSTTPPALVALPVIEATYAETSAPTPVAYVETVPISTHRELAVTGSDPFAVTLFAVSLIAAGLTTMVPSWLRRN